MYQEPTRIGTGRIPAPTSGLQVGTRQVLTTRPVPTIQTVVAVVPTRVHHRRATIMGIMPAQAIAAVALIITITVRVATDGPVLQPMHRPTTAIRVAVNTTPVRVKAAGVATRHQLAVVTVVRVPANQAISLRSVAISSSRSLLIRTAGVTLSRPATSSRNLLIVRQAVVIAHQVIVRPVRVVAATVHPVQVVAAVAPGRRN